MPVTHQFLAVGSRKIPSKLARAPASTFALSIQYHCRVSSPPAPLTIGSPRHPTVNPSENKERFLQVFTRLAPNLREVTILSSNAFTAIGESIAIPTAMPRHLPGKPGDGSRRIALRSFRIYSDFGLISLIHWDDIIQFSRLEALTVQGPVTTTFLRDLTLKVSLTCLRSLELSICPFLTPYYLPVNPELDQSMERFLHSMPTLIKLTL